MSLDLTQLVAQVEDLAASLKTREGERRARLVFALETLQSPAAELNHLARKIETSKATWLVAGLRERIDLRERASRCPENCIVLASDGSHIDVDRHHSARCFLINIGIAQLQYGRSPDACLSTLPLLYFQDGEVAISSPDGREVPIEGQLLGIKRSVEECRLLTERAREVQAALPIVGLLDGSLILWGLAGQTYPDFVIHELLTDGLLKHLDVLTELHRNRQLAVASYVSFPRSTDVVNALRLAICPHQPVDCDHCCDGKSEGKECDAVGGLLDRDLFGQLLSSGERSAIFSSRSSVVKKHYGIHEVNFFYVKLDEEVARVEIPLWVAEEKELVGLVHSVILDQCQRGLGYPVALSEAHEKAVVTGGDREQFWGLVEQTLAESGMWLENSAKQQSKRTRWI